MKPSCVWFDIPVTDMARAVTFYETIFETQLQRVSCGPQSEMAIFPEQTGCLARQPSYLPSMQGPTITFGTDEAVSAMLTRAVAAGGSVVRDVTAIECEGRGVFALIADTEGNQIGIHGQR